MSASARKNLIEIKDNFNLKSAKRIKIIESKTNHDVKAVEYYIREEMANYPNLKKVEPFKVA